MKIEELLRDNATRPVIRGETAVAAALIGLGMIGAAYVLAEAIKGLSESLSHAILPGDPRDLL